MMKDELRVGDRIEVYRNLHKNCFSIRKNGRVVKYLHDEDRLNMRDIKFAVQPAGHAKVIREQRKNVHAFVRGTFAGYTDGVLAWQQRVSYNPYKHDYFFSTFGGNTSPVYKARYATLSQGQVYVNP